MAFGAWPTPSTAARPKVTIWSDDATIGRVDIDDMVLGFQSSKGVDSPHGSFSLQLMPHATGSADGPGRSRDQVWARRALRPNTVVSLGMDTPGGIMLGLVDRCEVTRQTATINGQGQVSTTVRVSGRDMGKALVVDNIMLNAINIPNQPKYREAVAAALGADHPLLSWIYGVHGPGVGDSSDPAMTFEGATIKDAARFILQFAPSLRLDTLRAVFGGVGEAGDWIDVNRHVTDWNDGRIWNRGLNRYQGTVWGFIQSIIDPDLYEVRLDSIPMMDAMQLGERRVPSILLIIRPKPHTDTVLERAQVADRPPGRRELRTLVHGHAAHRFHEGDLRRVSLGSDDGQAFSHYTVTSDHVIGGNPNTGAAGYAYPLVDTYNARRYGLRGYSASLSVVGGDIVKKDRGTEDLTGSLYTEVHDARNLLFNWYWANPVMLTGSIEVDGRDEYRAGDPVELPDEIGNVSGDLAPAFARRGLTAYCTAVSHSWQVGGDYVTTMELTRCYNDGMIQAERTRIIRDAPGPANLVHVVET